MRRGVTLPELMSVLLIMGMLAGVVVPPGRRLLERAAVAGAADRLSAVHEATRQSAIARGQTTRYEIDRSGPRVLLSARGPGARWDTLLVVHLGDVGMSVSQPTVTFSPLGIGSGASNTTVILTRGAAAETLTVSRTGRLRRW
jgi:prepilin-type N-terminal cleavage/methylation domain-containing protein